MAKLTRGTSIIGNMHEKTPRSLSSLVVPPELVDQIQIEEPSYKAELDKRDKDIANEPSIDDSNPLGDLPKPKYLHKVPPPLIEQIPEKPKPELKPSLKPDQQEFSAYQAVLNKSQTYFSPDKWRIFCQVYAETGRQYEAAHAAGVSSSTVAACRRNNPDFAEMYAEAYEQYKEKIHKEIYRRAVEGVEEDIYFKNGKVGTKRVYSDRLLELEAKRVDPTYRERNMQLDMNMTGGVLVVKDRETLTEGEWEKEFGKQLDPKIINQPPKIIK